MRGKKIVKNYYEFIPEIPQFSKKLKVERSGFVPRNVMIRKMVVAGEMNKLISDYENNQLLNRSNDDTKRAMSILNIKDMSRSEMIKLARSRYSDFKKDLTNLERAKVDLVSSIQGSNPIDASASASASSEISEKMSFDCKIERDERHLPYLPCGVFIFLLTVFL